MWLGWTAIALLIAGLALMPVPRVWWLGVTLFCLGLICAPLAVLLTEG